MTLPVDRSDREYSKFVEDVSGNVAVRTQLTVQDIEIGQVEIKDATTGTFAKVGVGSSAAVGDNALYVADANVKANQTNKTQMAQITDGTTEADVIATINSLKSDVSSVGGEAVVADNGAGSGVTKVVPMGAKYNSGTQTYNDGDMSMLQSDVNGNLKVAISSDIEIGAVELKDAASDQRASVIAANTAAPAYFVAQMPARYMATPPSLTDTFASPLLLDSTGRLLTYAPDIKPASTDQSAGNSKYIKTDTNGVIDLNKQGVEIYDSAGTNKLAVDASGYVTVNQGTSQWQVQSNSAAIATESTLSTLNTKFVTGTDIGDVTINNASGAAAVNIQDGGNAITVDGAVTVSATALDVRALTATDVVTTAVPSAVLAGTKTVADSGTPEALAGSTASKSVMVQAISTNTNPIFVGNAASQYVRLTANESVALNIDNLSKVYIKVTTNGEGVNYLGEA